MACSQRELYNVSLQISPFPDDYIKPVMRSNDDNIKLKKNKMIDSDESRDMKILQTSEKSINKNNINEQSYYLNQSSYYSFSNNSPYCDSTPFRSPSTFSNYSELSPLVPRKVDFDQKLFDSQVQSHKFTLHTILDSRPSSKSNILNNIK